MSKQPTISLEQLQKSVPSAFTTSRYSKASEKYQVANTSEIVKEFMKSGWDITRATQSMVNNPEKQGYQFHSIRMRNQDIKISENNKEFAEIVITNGHDTNHLLTISMGIYRQICSNGLVVSDSYIEPIKIKHVGETFKTELAQAITYASEKTEDLKRLMNTMKDKEITDEQQLMMAKQFFEFRMEKEPTDTQIDQILTAHREEDDGNQLWVTYNLLQENIIQGKFTYEVKKLIKDKKTKISEYQAKAISSVAKIQDLNKKMFDSAMSYA